MDIYISKFFYEHKPEDDMNPPINKVFKQYLTVLQNYKSLVWTERFLECGEFELQVYINNTIPDWAQLDNLVEIKDSDITMIIEGIKIETDVEEGTVMTVTGRSLESFLDRRLMRGAQSYMAYDDHYFRQDQERYQGALSEVLKNIYIFEFPDYGEYFDISGYTWFDSLKLDGELEKGNGLAYYFDETEKKYIFKAMKDIKIPTVFTNYDIYQNSLYSVLQQICKPYNIGVSLIIPKHQREFPDSENGTEILLRFNTVDNRLPSADEPIDKTRPYLLFSTAMGNLVSSTFTLSNTQYKNWAVSVKQEDNGYAEVRTCAFDNNANDAIKRHEIYVDASNVNMNHDDENVDIDQYISLVTEQGKKALSDHRIENKFEAEVIPGKWKYGKDFKLGNLVRIETDYGIKRNALITEYVISVDGGGITEHPTLQVFDGDEANTL